MAQKTNTPNTTDERPGALPQDPDDELEMADDDEDFEDDEELDDDSEVEADEDEVED